MIILVYPGPAVRGAAILTESVAEVVLLRVGHGSILLFSGPSEILFSLRTGKKQNSWEYDEKLSDWEKKNCKKKEGLSSPLSCLML